MDAPFSECVGSSSLHEDPVRMRRRIAREIDRVGYLEIPDVLAFRGASRAVWKRPGSPVKQAPAPARFAHRLPESAGVS